MLRRSRGRTTTGPAPLTAPGVASRARTPRRGPRRTPSSSRRTRARRRRAAVPRLPRTRRRVAGADVDRQPAVDELGREQPPEVLRGEVRDLKSWVLFGEFGAQSSKPVGDRAGADGFAALPDGPLEQERLWLAGDPFVRVVARGQRNGRRCQASVSQHALDLDQRQGRVVRHPRGGGMSQVVQRPVGGQPIVCALQDPPPDHGAVNRSACGAARDRTRVEMLFRPVHPGDQSALDGDGQRRRLVRP